MDKVKEIENLLIKTINKEIYSQRDEIIKQMNQQKNRIFDEELFILTNNCPYIFVGFKIDLKNILTKVGIINCSNYCDGKNYNILSSAVMNVFSKLRQVGWFKINTENTDLYSLVLRIQLEHRITNRVNDYKVKRTIKLISIEDLGFESTNLTTFISCYDFIYRGNDVIYNHLIESLSKINNENIKNVGLFDDSLLHVTLAVMYYLPLVNDIIKFDSYHYNGRVNNKITFLLRFQKICKGVLKYSKKFNVSYEQILNEIDIASKYILWHIDLNGLTEMTNYYRGKSISLFENLTNKITSQINEKSEITKLIAYLFRDKLINFNSSIEKCKSFTEAWDVTYSILMDLLILANSIGIDKLNLDIKNLEVKLLIKINDVYKRCEFLNKEIQQHLKSHRDEIDAKEYEDWVNGVTFKNGSKWSPFGLEYWEVEEIMNIISS